MICGWQKEMNNTNEIQPSVDWNFNKIRYFENVWETCVERRAKRTQPTDRDSEKSGKILYSPDYRMPNGIPLVCPRVLEHNVGDRTEN